MLKYQYKIKTASKDEEIELDDFYISSNLSYISGTTSINHKVATSDKLWVTSSYFPNRLSVKIDNLDIVNRNGYITYPIYLDIKTVKYIDINNSINKDIKYVEYNGNVYFQNTSSFFTVRFNIDGVQYQANVNDTQLQILDKAYIEDEKVTIDGYTYDVIINKDISYTIFLDSIGENVDIPNSWDLSNIQLHPSQVQKIVIKNQDTSIINYNSLSYYALQPYIVYNYDRYNLNSYYDEDEEKYYLAVYIDDVEYKMDEDFIDSTIDFQQTLENYGQYELYNSFEDDTIPYLVIGEEKYQIYFEPCSPSLSSRLCLELSQEHMPILANDIIDVNLTYTTGILTLRSDSSGNEYIYCNGKRINRILGLCDTITLDSVSYPINYPVTNGSYYVGMVCNIETDNGDLIYFVVNSMSDGYVRSLSKVKKDEDGNWQYSMTVSHSTGETVTYGSGTTYTVNNYDGVLIDGVKVKIEKFQNTIDDEDFSYEYVNATIDAHYQLKVEDTVGSNKLICKLNINEKQFSDDDYVEVITNAYNIMMDDTCVITKRPNCFGRYNIDPELWVNSAYDAKGTSSIYELGNFENNITINKSSSYFNLPLSLSKNINNDMSRDDLIIGSYYDEKVDDGINKIVDMDKDMYTPIFINAGNTPSFVEKMTFNLHFRTRDMSTWSIYEDEGYKTSGETYDESGNLVTTGVKVQLSTNSDFCNWFVTDYYPYNQVSNSASSVYNNASIDKMMERSDLLGLLYFTTDDVKKKRKKLSKSFLRLTYFDSTDPEKQNMIGTSTLFFDCDRYFDTIVYPAEDCIYEDVVMSTVGNRLGDGVSHLGYTECFAADTSIKPKVTNDVFETVTESNVEYSNASKLYTSSDDYLPRLDSRIVVSERNTTTTSSEGFYAYILKAFADKSKTQTIYMKMEFFHAGIGIKIPMVLATKPETGNVNAIVNWTLEDLENFKSGYDLDEIYQRMYIPINISYNTKLKRFVYAISTDNSFSDAIVGNDVNTWTFNLFELKTKAQ